jgi:membrane associated rhomboid family serine protease
MELTKQEKRKLFHSFLFPSLFVFTLWLIKSCETIFEINNLYRYGIYPRTLIGVSGVFFSPLLHAGWEHLSSNTLPVLILGSFLFYFYRPLSYKIFLLIYFASGIWIWAFARPSFHIGASGLIYGLSMFLFASGIMRKDFRLMGISALVVFLYGSIFMSMFPLVKKEISWESHLLGALAGLVTAFYYRKQGPQRPQYSWENELEEDDISEDALDFNDGGNIVSAENSIQSEAETPFEIDKDNSIPPIIFRYHFKEKDDENKKD